MPISRRVTKLSKPKADERVPAPVLAYFKTRNRMRLFTAIHREMRKAGVSRSELARRMGKGPDRISHLLSAPQNLTIDTVSEILFCISGAEVNYDPLSYPLDKAARNQRRPEWLDTTQGRGSTSSSFRATTAPPGTGLVTTGTSGASVLVTRLR